MHCSDHFAVAIYKLWNAVDLCICSAFNSCLQTGRFSACHRQVPVNGTGPYAEPPADCAGRELWYCRYILFPRVCPVTAQNLHSPFYTADHADLQV